MSGIDKSKSVYHQTEPVDKLQKSEASKILLDDYDFSTNVIEVVKKDHNGEFKLATDVNVPVCDESEGKYFKFLWSFSAKK